MAHALIVHGSSTDATETVARRISDAIGDQEIYPDSVVDAIGIIAEAAEKAGATPVGMTAGDGYTFGESRAVRDGRFPGLAIDEEIQSDPTGSRIAAWAAELLR